MTDIDRPALDGELIDLPPEPPHDHIVITGWGSVYLWSDEANSWLEVDSQYGMNETWEDIARMRPLTVYAPIKEYK
ncbi:hypothetical protein ACWIDS_16250 [Dietzia maris]